jgi:large exoprotein involved in heme utilization and adhesion
VTGNNPSEIYGTIKSSIQGADFYLLNPNGVLFGENASLDITGSFYATTANYIDFADGYRMDTAVNPDMTFTSAAPSDFGFTTNTPGNIDVNGSKLSVNDGKTISLIGGDITLNGGTLSASDGIINVASVASAGEVTPTPDNLEIVSFTELGNVNLGSDANIDVSGNSGGRVVIRGGALKLNRSSINANTKTSGFGSNSFSENVDIATKESIDIFDFSSIRSNVGIFSTSETKGIKLVTKKLNIYSSSSVESKVMYFSKANAGDISISSNTLNIDNDSSIMSQTDGFGDGGNIELNAEHIKLSDHSNIIAKSNKVGEGGNLTIKTKDFQILNGSRVGAESTSGANISSVDIYSENISIKGPEVSDEPFESDFTGIGTLKRKEGSKGGDISIYNTNTISLDSRGVIETYNNDSTDKSDISIKSDKIYLNRGSSIRTESDNAGNGGDINITSDLLEVSGIHENYLDSVNGFPTIHLSNIITTGPSSVLSTGDTGTINIKSTNLNIYNGATIRSLSSLSNGAVGKINIASKNINISGTNDFFKNVLMKSGIPEPLAIETVSSNIVSRSRFVDIAKQGDLPPDTGGIKILTDNLSLDKGGFISTETNNILDSGNITITATNGVSMERGAYIKSTGAFGDSGTIDISTNTLYLDGNNGLSGLTGIYSNTFNLGGKGGSINISADDISLLNNAIVTSETTGDGDGGDIKIDSSTSVKLINNSKIKTRASQNSSGDAGNISIKTDLFVLSDGIIETSAISGHGGNVTITSGNILISQNSVIDPISQYSISGTVTLLSNNNLTTKLIPLEAKPIDVSALFTNNCTSGPYKTSSFITSKDFTNFGYANIIQSIYEAKAFDSPSHTHEVLERKYDHKNFQADNVESGKFLTEFSSSTCRKFN